MKRLTAILLILSFTLICLCGSLTLGASASELTLIGDTDGDGIITVCDALYILRVSANIVLAAEGIICDVDDNGSVTTADALNILRSAIGLIGSYGYAGVELSFTPNEAATAVGVTQEMLTRAVVSEGNTARLADLMNRAATGEDITIGVIGGSITAGSAASSSSKEYGSLLSAWWRTAFPDSSVTYRNAGIGATGSVIGVHRAPFQLLSYEPDLVVVEFAVNDTASVQDTIAYESLIRRILANDTNTAVIMLFMSTDTGYNVQSAEIPLGNNYGIPMISYRDAIYPEITQGRLLWTDISPDTIHPNDKGHAITASLITSYLQGVKEQAQYLSTVITTELPDTVVGNKYENGIFITPNEYTPLNIGGWKVTTSYQFYDFDLAWRATKRCQDFTISVTASEIFIAYRKGIDIDCGTMTVSIDGGEAVEVVTYFENGWGSYMSYQQVYDSQDDAEHTVRISCRGGNCVFWGLLIS